MKNLFKIIAAGATVAVMGAGMASAATVNATSITVGMATATTQTSTTTRSDLGNALGASDAFQSGSLYGGFYSLGIGGSADFGFGTNFGAPGAVIEVTAGARNGHVESVLVSAFNVLTADWEVLGTITNQGATSLALAIPLPLGAVYSALRLKDMSVGTGRDGFDVDSISVTAVPLPAGGLLLLGALGGIAALRRRKTAV